jgi:hypothetical protein
MKVGLTKGREAIKVESSLGCLPSEVHREADGYVIVALQFGSTMEKFQFPWETLLVTDSSSSVC